MIQKIYIVLAVFLLYTGNGVAQKIQKIPQKSPALALIIDSTVQHCYAYHFEPGDSLVYRVISYDSVIFVGRPPLLKQRLEILTLRCDSATRDGRFFLRQTLRAFSSNERAGTESAMRNESPWIDRTVFLTINRFGERISWSYADTSLHAQTPGGPFQPVLLVNFRDSCKFQNESWVIERDEFLPENGYPAPTRHNGSIYRTLSDIDTLGERHQRFQYTLAGSGQAISFNEQTRSAVGVGSTLAEFGEIRILKRLGIPTFFLGTVEQKLAFKSVTGKELYGLHKIMSVYSLVSFYRKSEAGKPPLDLEGKHQHKKKSSAKSSKKK